MSSPRKILYHLRENWTFCSCLQYKPFCEKWKLASSETGYSSEEEYEYAYTINYIESKKPPMCQVQLNGKAVEMIAQVHLLTF